MSNQLMASLDIYDVVEQYEAKKETIPTLFEEIKGQCNKLSSMCSTMGAYGGSPFRHEFRHNYVEDMLATLKKSSWRFVYQKLNIKHIAPQTHLKHFEGLLEKPPEFDVENIRGVFKEYVTDPRSMSLQAFAEIFCRLDKFYKSHDNMKVGVKGLPKRIIIANCGGFYHHGASQLADVINCLMRYRGQYDLCVTEYMAKDIFEGKSALEVFRSSTPVKKHEKLNALSLETEPHTYQGLKFKAYMNGNCHVIFDKRALGDINRALAEYYGEILPDAYEHTDKKAESTAVSKDLQFYGTPQKAANYIIDEISFHDGDEFLEPSCGKGALMDAIRRHIAGKYYHSSNRPAVSITGVEVHAQRAQETRDKGFSVICANFLSWQTDRRFDKVAMNPPFYGKHYAKHVAKAYSLLKPGGALYAILPITARDGHGIIDETYDSVRWRDLPVGSFHESGTNINTVLATIWKGE